MISKYKKWLNWNLYQDALAIAAKLKNVKLQQAIVMAWVCNVNLPGDIRALGSDVNLQKRIIDLLWRDMYIIACIKRYCIDADPMVQLVCKVPWETFPGAPMGNFRDPTVISWVKQHVRTERYSFTVLEPTSKPINLTSLKRIIYGDKYVRL